ncbi:hypothetical protein [Sporosarcina trichiuri]|uniref:hypothetical protein n=1 Tax=Sporosarcina trichiuri TaxID=3056445 RepID=UPI0025B292B5|nr:hypothetical protein [Sporosarcina sp. 0.2-SM1T-5]WJY27278.1 hypothetical protein QWT68_14750 [Sporosarcina sp. 0.2-SM1T-5]
MKIIVLVLASAALALGIWSLVSHSAIVMKSMELAIGLMFAALAVQSFRQGQKVTGGLLAAAGCFILTTVVYMYF